MQRQRFLQRPSYRILLIGLVSGLIVAGCIVLGVWLLTTEKTTTISLGDAVFTARRATSQSERAKGLGGVARLAHDEAMLLVSPDDQWNRIWMKDMRIPIDALWLDKDKNIVHIERSLQPNSYPQTYGPDIPTRYVIEVADHVTADASIRVGMQAVISLSEERK